MKVYCIMLNITPRYFVRTLISYVTKLSLEKQSTDSREYLQFYNEDQIHTFPWKSAIDLCFIIQQSLFYFFMYMWCQKCPLLLWGHSDYLKMWCHETANNKIHEYFKIHFSCTLKPKNFWENFRLMVLQI